jgi:benzoyl-CoA reductase/2-hydroxyglutaryl-CoA dehydratase subunit BcrC/BadD/HgdB
MVFDRDYPDEELKEVADDAREKHKECEKVRIGIRIPPLRIIDS